MTIINPKALATHTIGEDLKSADDYLFEAEALPNATSKTSTAIRIGGTHAGVEIKSVADTAATIAEDDTLTFAIQVSSDSTDGTDGTFATVFSETITGAAGDTTVAVGESFHEPWVPNVEGDNSDVMWAKVVVTASADQSASDVNTYIRAVRT